MSEEIKNELDPTTLQETVTEPAHKNNKIEISTSQLVARIIIYTVLITGCLIMIFPYFYMLMSSLKTSAEAANSLKITLFPKKFQWVNYKEVWGQINLFRSTLNTLLIEVTVIPIGTFVAALAAFSFAKLKLKHKTFWLLFLMSGMMVPYAALLLPQYRTFTTILGWTEEKSLLPLIIPGFFGNTSMMFFFIQYMKGIPTALFESAKIDGSGYFRMFFSIMLPLIGAALAAQIVFWFVGIWNDFFAPSIYLKTKSVRTLQVSLKMLTNQNGQNTNLVMAGSVLSSIPLIVIYVCFQNFFIESMAITGIKG